MHGLAGKRIAVAADRRAKEISQLIQNFGGEAVIYSVQGKQILDEQKSESDVKTLVAKSFDWVVLTTGIGIRTLADSAQSLQCHHAFMEKLSNESLAVRGKKTNEWLKEHQLHAALLAHDGTMDQLVIQLEQLPKQKTIFFQAYNQDDAKWKSIFEQRGYEVYLSKPYYFEKPSAETLKSLYMEVLNSTVDAVVFTSKTQVKNILQGKEAEKLVDSFNSGVQAVAVGKSTAEELLSYGIHHVLQPERQKMGAMIAVLDRFYKEQKEN